MTDANKMILGLERRLLFLQQRIQIQRPVGERDEVMEADDDDDARSLSERIVDLERRLKHTLSQRPLLDQLSKMYYEKYRALLTADDYEHEQHGLTTRTKAELILAVEEDLKQSAEAIEELVELEKHVNPPEFRALNELTVALDGLTSEQEKQNESLASLENELTDLLLRYNTAVTTLSEIFVSWDQLLRALDLRISALEKASM